MKLLLGMTVLVVVLCGPRAGLATYIYEQEPNDTPTTAQNVDGYFSSENDPYIFGGPHVSIIATGDGTYDFYRFTSTGALIWLDIDFTNTDPVRNDTEIGIWDSAGKLLNTNDDALADPGSQIDPNAFVSPCCGPGSFDSHMGAGFGPGSPFQIFTVGVCRYDCFFADGFSMTGDAERPGDFYTLHISAVAVSEPSALLLFCTGLVSFCLYRVRRQVT